MLVPNAKCSTLSAGAYSLPEEAWRPLSSYSEVEATWACGIKRNFLCCRTGKYNLVWHPERSQAQTPGLWTYWRLQGDQEASCSPGIWRMKLAYFFFFFSFCLFLSQHSSSKCWFCPSIQPSSFLNNCSAIKTHLIPCIVWCGRERVFLLQSQAAFESDHLIIWGQNH